MERYSIKVGVMYMNVCVSKRLKEELAWAIDKWLRILVIKCFLKQLHH